MDHGGLKDLLPHVLQLPAFHLDRHVMAGKAALANILAQVLGILPLVGVMAGAAFRLRIEELVMEGALARLLQVLFVALGAFKAQVLVLQKVANRGAVRVMASGTALSAGRVLECAFTRLDLCVTLEAQPRLGSLDQLGIRPRVISMAAIAPLLQKGGMGDGIAVSLGRRMHSRLVQVLSYLESTGAEPASCMAARRRRRARTTRCQRVGRHPGRWGPVLGGAGW
jgi:hypothetical protein